MRERIREIIENENLSPAKFADKLDINRAVVSHILNGRNNPSLDVVTKILSEMDYINADWLLNGKGSMYKDGYTDSLSQDDQSLFNIDELNTTESVRNTEYAKEKELSNMHKAHIPVEKQGISHDSKVERKVKQIIIYYTDNTFETFTPH